MSHVTLVSGIRVPQENLAVLAAEAAALGAELVMDQKSFRAYFSDNRCVHAIRLKTRTADTYEVGLVHAQGAPGAFDLKYDPFMSGYGLEAALGQGLAKLKQGYSMGVGEAELAREGWRTSREQLENGEQRVYAYR